MKSLSLLIAALLIFGSTLQTAGAADALTTATSSTAGKGLLRSLLGNKRADDGGYSQPLTASDRINKSILALPFGILKSLGRGVSRMANKTVSDHISHVN